MGYMLEITLTVGDIMRFTRMKLNRVDVAGLKEILNLPCLFRRIGIDKRN